MFIYIYYSFQRYSIFIQFLSLFNKHIVSYKNSLQFSWYKIIIDY